MKRYHIIVKGSVQAVGFRFTVTMMAEKLGVTGWVRNKYDGTVEVEAQGKDLEIEEFVSGVKEGPGYSDVSDVVVEEMATIDGERRFEIKVDE